MPRRYFYLSKNISVFLFAHNIFLLFRSQFFTVLIKLHTVASVQGRYLLHDHTSGRQAPAFLRRRNLSRAVRFFLLCAVPVHSPIGYAVLTSPGISQGLIKHNGGLAFAGYSPRMLLSSSLLAHPDTLLLYTTCFPSVPSLFCRSASL